MILKQLKYLLLFCLTFLLGLQSLFAINIATLSADIYTSIEIKKLAKAVAERANQKNIAIPQKIAKDIENLGGVKVKNVVANAGGFKVDNTLKLADESAGVLVNGKYLKNPTAKNVTELIKNPSGTMKLNQKSNSVLNGQYMYVVDEADNIIIGTRAIGINPFNGKAPHPTLIGGVDPTVKTAGIIEFRGGKIYKVDNISGHFKPSAQSLQNSESIFKQYFSSNNFATDFQGFIPFKN